MPSSMIYLPLSEKRPLAEHELQKITAELRKLDAEFSFKVLMGFGAAFTIANLPIHAPGKESLVGQFGLFNGLVAAFSLLFIPVFWMYYSKKRKLKKDLNERAKIIRSTNVARKESSFLTKKIYARIDGDEPVCHEFEVDGFLFDRLQQGQHVKLEFAPNSKCLLNIEYPVEG